MACPEIPGQQEEQNGKTVAQGDGIRGSLVFSPSGQVGCVSMICFATRGLTYGSVLGACVNGCPEGSSTIGIWGRGFEMREVTLSVIKADVGSIGGHTKPSGQMLGAVRTRLREACW